MKKLTIAEKNDLCRSTFFNCKVLLTDGLRSSPSREAVISAVREFNNFHEGNDPYGEHDFSFFVVNEEKFFFKFDYYDSQYEGYQEDGNRVLTIGYADEY